MHEITTKQCHPSPSPSPPIMVTSNRRLPLPGSLTKGHVLSQYSDSFEGIGSLGPPVHFQMDEHVRPVQMPVHRIPVAKRTKEKEALDKYTAEGIIAKVSEPTSWCSNELICETPKKFRVCIDPSQTINKAIQRPIYQMPALNEELHWLNAAKCFSLVNVMYESNSRMPMPPPRADPRAFDIFYFFWSNSPPCGPFLWSNASLPGDFLGVKCPAPRAEVTNQET